MSHDLVGKALLMVTHKFFVFFFVFFVFRNKKKSAILIGNGTLSGADVNYKRGRALPCKKGSSSIVTIFNLITTHTPISTVKQFHRLQIAVCVLSPTFFLKQMLLVLI